MTRGDKSKFEDELRFGDLIDAMTTPTDDERDFYRQRQELGKDVGLDGMETLSMPSVPLIRRRSNSPKPVMRYVARYRFGMLRSIPASPTGFYKGRESQGRLRQDRQGPDRHAVRLTVVRTALRPT